jgi:DNA-binding CsgD family transcriptional regulator
MLGQALALAEHALAAADARQASERFFETAKTFGATYIQTRLYRRPSQRLTSATHWAAGGFVLRVAPQSWASSPAFDYVCFECNPLLAPIRQSRTRYRFSDFAPHDRSEFGTYWEALDEAGISDAICATSYGPDRAIASLHLGFGARDIAADNARTLQMAGLLLTERLIDLADLRATDDPNLTRREIDCMAFVADGKTDWEISVILGISEATVRFHIDNARRKLDAVNRTQAVARLVQSGEI